MATAEAPRTRRTFARLNNALEVPNLIAIQRRSFIWLTDPESGGLRETIDDGSPIEDYTGNLAVQFGEFHFDEPVASLEQCREKDLTYARPLTVTVAFINRETGEIREQSVFMGDFPWMTERGTFVDDGERARGARRDRGDRDTRAAAGRAERHEGAVPCVCLRARPRSACGDRVGRSGERVRIRAGAGRNVCAWAWRGRRWGGAPAIRRMRSS